MARLSRLTAVVALALFAVACAHIQLVAEYDEKTLEETIRIGKRVDSFYGKLDELDPEKRTYAKFSDDWVDIGSDIQSLVRRNEARPMNDESLQISRGILSFWQSYHKTHKDTNGYKVTRFDHSRFERLFTAACRAEAAKQDDKPPAGDGAQ